MVRCSSIKPLLVLLLPLILLPLPLIVQDSVATFAYCLLLIAIYWVFELLPIYATALLPMVLLPLAGLAQPSNLSKQYMPEVCMLLLGTLVMAAAIESSGVHKRLALLALTVFGQSARSLMFGLMLVTWFLSMWISNTATTSLMLPVLEAIFKGYQTSFEGELPSQISKGLTLSLAAAANVGGAATLTGTPPNLVCATIMEDMFSCYEPKLSFAKWLSYGLPVSFTIMLACYLFSSTYWFGVPFIKFTQDPKVNAFSGDTIKNVCRKQYQSLPKITFAEIYTVLTIIFVVILWFFKSPGFIDGWADLYPSKVFRPSDSTVAIFFAVLFFVMPNRLPQGINFWKHPIDFYLAIDFEKPILTWKFFVGNCPWGTLILIGSGIALSRVSEESGFSQFIADQLSSLEGLNPGLILFLIVGLITFLTEVTSNTATSNLILPIVAQLAVQIKINPLFLTVPATFACVQAFMLPVATGVNALCFSHGRLRIPDMVKHGIFLNCIGIGIITLYGLYYGPMILDANNFNQTWIYDPNYCY